jgi:hypothetical protein
MRRIRERRLERSIEPVAASEMVDVSDTVRVRDELEPWTIGVSVECASFEV